MQQGKRLLGLFHAKLEYVSINSLLIVLVILLVAFKKQVTESTAKGSTSIGTSSQVTYVDTLTKDFRTSYKTISLTFAAADFVTLATCYTQLQGYFRSGTFLHTKISTCQGSFNSSRNYSVYYETSVQSLSNLFYQTNSTTLNQTSGSFTVDGSIVSQAALTIDLYSVIVEVMLNDIAYILSSSVDSTWKASVTADCELMKAASFVSDPDLLTVFSPPLDAFAAAMNDAFINGVATYSITSTVRESNIEFLLRVSGYTFFIDIIFKVFTWFFETKECVDEPPCSEGASTDKKRTSEPVSPGTTAHA
eukprot:TRINITY_DN4242_c0_g1_i1.p1 TRINITY_DN4242_c0_g1~~TRINITY_DN4242_c0_g1_i1.p1  ORF type:complete len:306 (-),score=60.70 TRINITY_DN4242_c0_g1_i1:57-974(-)